MNSLEGVALELCRVFDSLAISYAIGGSFASSVHGIARPTQDLDFVAAIGIHQAEALAASLQKHVLRRRHCDPRSDSPQALLQCDSSLDGI